MYFSVLLLSLSWLNNLSSVLFNKHKKYQKMKKNLDEYFSWSMKKFLDLTCHIRYIKYNALGFTLFIKISSKVYG